MRALVTATALSIITASVISAPAFAASPKVEAAIKVFQAVGADANKLKIFCEIIKIDDQMGTKEDAAKTAQIDKLSDQLGPDFAAAWDTAEDTDDDSPDGKALNDVLDQVSAKCP
jgi:hypothetical protein